MGNTEDHAGGKLVVNGSVSTKGEYFNATANGEIIVADGGDLTATILNVENGGVKLNENDKAGKLDIQAGGTANVVKLDVRDGGTADIAGDLNLVGQQGSYGLRARNNGKITTDAQYSGSSRTSLPVVVHHS